MIDPIPIADHAAAQSDRWLFIALLLVLGSVVAFIWRFMVAERSAMTKRLEDITDRHIASQEKLSAVVSNNTSALNEVKLALSNCLGWRAGQLPDEKPIRKWIAPHKHEND